MELINFAFCIQNYKKQIKNPLKAPTTMRGFLLNFYSECSKAVVTSIYLPTTSSGNV